MLSSSAVNSGVHTIHICTCASGFILVMDPSCKISVGISIIWGELEDEAMVKESREESVRIKV